uniref:Uncharacterized protein n=1 Tax=Ananas comosus var. bracteatus TaxID=296719 RepID=A0A6V7P4Y9_ANACO|nr:unnamed protein product [Ananas comosus var. bracteatus]
MKEKKVEKKQNLGKQVSNGDYKLPTSREAPIQAQNQLRLKFDPPQSSNRKLEATKVPQKLKFTSARFGQFSPRGTGLPDLGPVSQPAPENPTFGNRSLPARDRSLPAQTRSGPVSTARDRLPRRHRSTVHWGTGLSYQGPVPESKNSQDTAKTLEIELLGRYTIDGPPPSVKKFGMQIEHSNLAICKESSAPAEARDRGKGIA